MNNSHAQGATLLSLMKCIAIQNDNCTVCCPFFEAVLVMAQNNTSPTEDPPSENQLQSLLFFNRIFSPSGHFNDFLAKAMWWATQWLSLWLLLHLVLLWVWGSIGFSDPIFRSDPWNVTNTIHHFCPIFQNHCQAWQKHPIFSTHWHQIKEIWLFCDFVTFFNKNKGTSLFKHCIFAIFPVFVLTNEDAPTCIHCLTNFLHNSLAWNSSSDAGNNHSHVHIRIWQKTSPIHQGQNWKIRMTTEPFAIRVCENGAKKTSCTNWEKIVHAGLHHQCVCLHSTLCFPDATNKVGTPKRWTDGGQKTTFQMHLPCNPEHIGTFLTAFVGFGEVHNKKDPCPWMSFMLTMWMHQFMFLLLSLLNLFSCVCSGVQSFCFIQLFNCVCLNSWASSQCHWWHWTELKFALLQWETNVMAWLLVFLSTSFSSQDFLLAELPMKLGWHTFTFVHDWQHMEWHLSECEWQCVVQLVIRLQASKQCWAEQPQQEVQWQDENQSCKWRLEGTHVFVIEKVQISVVNPRTRNWLTFAFSIFTVRVLIGAAMLPGITNKLWGKDLICDARLEQVWKMVRECCNSSSCIVLGNAVHPTQWENASVFAHCDVTVEWWALVPDDMVEEEAEMQTDHHGGRHGGGGHGSGRNLPIAKQWQLEQWIEHAQHKEFKPCGTESKHVDTCDSVLDSHLGNLNNASDRWTMHVRSCKRKGLGARQNPRNQWWQELILTKKDADDNTVMKEEEVDGRKARWKMTKTKLQSWSSSLKPMKLNAQKISDCSMTMRQFKEAFKVKPWNEHVSVGRTTTDRLKRESNFDDEMRNDPMVAPEQIQGFMFVPAKAKCEHDASDKTIERFTVDTKQEDGEGLINCCNRHEQAKKMFEASFGKDILRDFATNIAALCRSWRWCSWNWSSGQSTWHTCHAGVNEECQSLQTWQPDEGKTLSGTRLMANSTKERTGCIEWTPMGWSMCTEHEKNQKEQRKQSEKNNESAAVTTMNKKEHSWPNRKETKVKEPVLHVEKQDTCPMNVQKTHRRKIGMHMRSWMHTKHKRMLMMQKKTVTKVMTIVMNTKRDVGIFLVEWCQCKHSSVWHVECWRRNSAMQRRANAVSPRNRLSNRLLAMKELSQLTKKWNRKIVMTDGPTTENCGNQESQEWWGSTINDSKIQMHSEMNCEWLILKWFIDWLRSSIFIPQRRITWQCDEKANMPMRLKTNAGGKQLECHGELRGFEQKAWKDLTEWPECAVHGWMSDQHHMTHDNAKEDVFTLSKWGSKNDKDSVKFMRNHVSNLCSCKSARCTCEQRSTRTDTISRRQQLKINWTVQPNSLKQQNEHKSSCGAAGAPGVERMKMIDCTIGHAMIQWQWMHQESNRCLWKRHCAFERPHSQITTNSVDEVMHTPKESKTKNNSITLHMDVVDVSQRSFLASIGEPTCHWDAQVAESKNKLVSCMKHWMTLFGNTTKLATPSLPMCCDNEFRTLMKVVEDEFQTGAWTSPHHEDMNQQQNRTTKWSWRMLSCGIALNATQSHTMSHDWCTHGNQHLEFEHVPSQAQCIHQIQSKCSMAELPLDCDKHLKCATGKCGHVHLDCHKTNDNIEWTIDAMHLCPAIDNVQGGHAAMNLNAGKWVGWNWFAPHCQWKCRHVRKLNKWLTIKESLTLSFTQANLTLWGWQVWTMGWSKGRWNGAVSQQKCTTAITSCWLACRSWIATKTIAKKQKTKNAQSAMSRIERHHTQMWWWNRWKWNMWHQGSCKRRTWRSETMRNWQSSSHWRWTLWCQIWWSWKTRTTRQQFQAIRWGRRRWQLQQWWKEHSKWQDQQWRESSFDETIETAWKGMDDDMEELEDAIRLEHHVRTPETGDQTPLDTNKWRHHHRQKQNMMCSWWMKRKEQNMNKPKPKHWQWQQATSWWCWKWKVCFDATAQPQSGIENLWRWRWRCSSERTEAATCKEMFFTKNAEEHNNLWHTHQKREMVPVAWEWPNEEESVSPTACADSLFHTVSIDSKENRDVVTGDAPKAFMQTELQNWGKEKVIMKIAGVPVDMSLEDSPDACSDHVVCENNKKVSCAEASQAIHGILVSTSPFHLKFWDDLWNIGFVLNCCDARAAERWIDGKQCTMRFHADDSMSSHEDSKNESWIPRMVKWAMWKFRQSDCKKRKETWQSWDDNDFWRQWSQDWFDGTHKEDVKGASDEVWGKQQDKMSNRNRDAQWRFEWETQHRRMTGRVPERELKHWMSIAFWWQIKWWRAIWKSLVATPKMWLAISVQVWEIQTRSDGTWSRSSVKSISVCGCACACACLSGHNVSVSDCMCCRFMWQCTENVLQMNFWMHLMTCSQCAEHQCLWLCMWMFEWSQCECQWLHVLHVHVTVHRKCFANKFLDAFDDMFTVWEKLMHQWHAMTRMAQGKLEHELIGNQQMTQLQQWVSREPQKTDKARIVQMKPTTDWVIGMVWGSSRWRRCARWVAPCMMFRDNFVKTIDCLWVNDKLSRQLIVCGSMTWMTVHTSWWSLQCQVIRLIGKCFQKRTPQTVWECFLTGMQWKNRKCAHLWSSRTFSQRMPHMSCKIHWHPKPRHTHQHLKCCIHNKWMNCFWKCCVDCRCGHHFPMDTWQVNNDENSETTRHWGIARTNAEQHGELQHDETLRCQLCARHRNECTQNATEVWLRLQLTWKDEFQQSTNDKKTQGIKWSSEKWWQSKPKTGMNGLMQLRSWTVMSIAGEVWNPMWFKEHWKIAGHVSCICNEKTKRLVINGEETKNWNCQMNQQLKWIHMRLRNIRRMHQGIVMSQTSSAVSTSQTNFLKSRIVSFVKGQQHSLCWRKWDSRTIERQSRDKFGQWKGTCEMKGQKRTGNREGWKWSNKTQCEEIAFCGLTFGEKMSAPLKLELGNTTCLPCKLIAKRLRTWVKLLLLSMEHRCCCKLQMDQVGVVAPKRQAKHETRCCWGGCMMHTHSELMGQWQITSLCCSTGDTMKHHIAWGAMQCGNKESMKNAEVLREDNSEWCTQNTEVQKCTMFEKDCDAMWMHLLSVTWSSILSTNSGHILSATEKQSFMMTLKNGFLQFTVCCMMKLGKEEGTVFCQQQPCKWTNELHCIWSNDKKVPNEKLFELPHSSWMSLCAPCIHQWFVALKDQLTMCCMAFWNIFCGTVDDWQTCSCEGFSNSQIVAPGAETSVALFSVGGAWISMQLQVHHKACESLPLFMFKPFFNGFGLLSHCMMTSSRNNSVTSIEILWLNIFLLVGTATFDKHISSGNWLWKVFNLHFFLNQMPCWHRKWSASLWEHCTLRRCKFNAIGDMNNCNNVFFLNDFLHIRGFTLEQHMLEPIKKTKFTFLLAIITISFEIQHWEICCDTESVFVFIVQWNAKQAKLMFDSPDMHCKREKEKKSRWYQRFSPYSRGHVFCQSGIIACLAASFFRFGGNIMSLQMDMPWNLMEVCSLFTASENPSFLYPKAGQVLSLILLQTKVQKTCIAQVMLFCLHSCHKTKVFLLDTGAIKPFRPLPNGSVQKWQRAFLSQSLKGFRYFLQCIIIQLHV